MGWGGSPRLCHVLADLGQVMDIHLGHPGKPQLRNVGELGEDISWCRWGARCPARDKASPTSLGEAGRNCGPADSQPGLTSATEFGSEPLYSFSAIPAMLGSHPHGTKGCTSPWAPVQVLTGCCSHSHWPHLPVLGGPPWPSGRLTLWGTQVLALGSGWAFPTLLGLTPASHLTPQPWLPPLPRNHGPLHAAALCCSPFICLANAPSQFEPSSHPPAPAAPSHPLLQPESSSGPGTQPRTCYRVTSVLPGCDSDGRTLWAVLRPIVHGAAVLGAAHSSSPSLCLPSPQGQEPDKGVGGTLCIWSDIPLDAAFLGLPVHGGATGQSPYLSPSWAGAGAYGAQGTSV